MSVVRNRGRVTMGEWIKDAMNGAEEGEVCAAFALVHMKGTIPDEVGPVCRLGAKDWSPDDLANMFQRRADIRSQDLPGTQTFNLLTFYLPADAAADRKVQLAITESAGATATRPSSDKYIFTVGGRLPTDVGGDGLTSTGTEAPTAAGVTQATMRQADSLFAQNRAMLALNFATMQQINQDLHQREKEAREEAADSMLLLKDMIIEQARAMHDHKMKELEFARASEERRLWVSFGPPLINAIVGREIFPQNMADTQIVEGLAEIVDEKDLMEIGQKIGQKHPEKASLIMGPLMARFEAAMIKKKAEQDRKADIGKRLAASSDPMSDAGGGINPALPAKGESST